MIPLGITSLISVAFILERGVALRRPNVIPADLYRAIFRLRIGESTSEIERLAAPGQNTLARLVRICLEHLPWSKSENVEAVQTQARSEIARLERGLIVLEIITGVAPLLGLLGTVHGLINVFDQVGQVGLGGGAEIAAGISIALHTTVMGLVIAIPSLIAHSYFSNKINSMSVEMESICADLLTKLYLQADEE